MSNVIESSYDDDGERDPYLDEKDEDIYPEGDDDDGADEEVED